MCSSDLRERLAKYQEETGHLYNLEATPAEGATYRFAKADKDLFGDQIICANEEAWRQGADPYYTNSTQLPVMANLDLFDALHAEKGIAFLFSSHDPRIVERVPRRVRLVDGRIASDERTGGGAA